MAVVSYVHLVSPHSQVSDDISATKPFGFVHQDSPPDALKVWVTSIIHQILDNIKLIYAHRNMHWASAIFILNCRMKETMILQNLKCVDVSVPCRIVLLVVILSQIRYPSIEQSELLINGQLDSKDTAGL